MQWFLFFPLNLQNDPSCYFFPFTKKNRFAFPYFANEFLILANNPLALCCCFYSSNQMETAAALQQVLYHDEDGVQ